MAELIIWITWCYLYIGMGMALIFLLFGIERVNREARGCYLFRILLIPGVIGLWPLVGWRWFHLERGRKS